MPVVLVRLEQAIIKAVRFEKPFLSRLFLTTSMLPSSEQLGLGGIPSRDFETTSPLFLVALMAGLSVVSAAEDTSFDRANVVL